MAAVAVPDAVVTTLPEESSTFTTGCWASTAPLWSVDEGGVVMTSWVAAPVDMVMLPLAADVKVSPVNWSV